MGASANKKKKEENAQNVLKKEVEENDQNVLKKEEEENDQNVYKKEEEKNDLNVYKKEEEKDQNEKKKEEEEKKIKMIIKIDNIKLNNGKTCPILGLGTSLIKTEKDIEVVYQSIVNGTRLIDTQPANEIIVGQGIKKAIDNKIVSRNDLFIVTKLELDEKEDPEKALTNSLKRLGLKYVDLYLDHWPSCRNYKNPDKYRLIPVKETWKTMEKLQNKELTRGIGVSNYNVENLLNILSICKIKPCVNEVEFHPYLYQNELKTFCDKEDIKLFAYNPLNKSKDCDQDFIIEKNYDLFKEASIIFLSNKYSKTKGQIILNWHKLLGIVPITGTKKPLRMLENLQSTLFSLNEDDIKLLSSFTEKQHRFNDGSNIFGIDIFA